MNHSTPQLVTNEMCLRLLENLPSGIYICDTEGMITYFNQRAVEVWGRAPKLNDAGERFCGSFKLYSGDGTPMRHDQCWMALAIENDEEYNGCEIVIERPDGSRLNILSHASPIHDDAGNLIGAVNVMADITERRQAESGLRESEDRIRNLLDTLPVAAYTCDAEGLITYFNPRAVEAWGRAPALNDTVERFCGSFKLYSSDGTPIPHDQSWMAMALKDEKIYDGRELVIERPDGCRMTVLANVTPIYNALGKLVGAINIVVDITDRKQAEAVMAQMAAIIESSDDAIVSKDLKGNVVSWNRGAEKLFGYTAEDVIGKPVKILFPTDRRNEESQILKRIRRGESLDHFETVLRRKDGHEIAVSLSVSPIRDKAGKVIGASKIARDISERKRIEAEREEMLLKESAARAEAEAANRSKDEFLAVVSHELRSPLNSILGYNRMLRNRPMDEAHVIRSSEIIERNARTQLQLIEDLLDTARIVSGKLKLDLRKLDIIPALADALDTVRLAAETKGVRLNVADSGLRIENSRSSNDHRDSAIVMGDAARLQQIVCNLLSNAIKFTPTGGSVKLRAERDEERIRITVSDTGIGIQPEFIHYVFDRFRQRDSSSSQRSGGLGLGLALVKHLAELHGGDIGATSEGYGRGAAFTFTIPLATQSEVPVAEPPALATGASLVAVVNGGPASNGGFLLPTGLTIAGLRVLVVDDQADARATLSDFLNSCGAVVMEASSGAEALTYLSNPPDGEPPDVLLCDIAMPDEDGYSALRRVRALEEARGVAAIQRIPAIALTGLTGAKERLRALSAGFYLHVAKPVDPVELMLLIANIAGMRHEGTLIH